MKRINSSVTPIRVGVGLGAAAAFAVGLMQVTADRFVDGNYDQAIAVASSLDRASDTQSGLLRLATHSVKVVPMLPTAATEHAWLTRPVMLGEPAHVEPVVKEPVVKVMSPAIGSTLGARFTIASADNIQTLEVIDVSEISAEQLNSGVSSTTARGKMLLVSCKIVGEAKSPGSKPSDGADVVRFIVDAGAAHPVRLPRAL
jgi:hypothetical protein